MAESNNPPPCPLSSRHAADKHTQKKEEQEKVPVGEK